MTDEEFIAEALPEEIERQKRGRVQPAYGYFLCGTTPYRHCANLAPTFPTLAKPQSIPLPENHPCREFDEAFTELKVLQTTYPELQVNKEELLRSYPQCSPAQYATVEANQGVAREVYRNEAYAIQARMLVEEQLRRHRSQQAFQQLSDEEKASIREEQRLFLERERAEAQRVTYNRRLQRERELGEMQAAARQQAERPYQDFVEARKREEPLPPDALVEGTENNRLYRRYIDEKREEWLEGNRLFAEQTKLAMEASDKLREAREAEAARRPDAAEKRQEFEQAHSKLNALRNKDAEQKSSLVGPVLALVAIGGLVVGYRRFKST